jgi:uncharacterized integral membrane protein
MEENRPAEPTNVPDPSAPEPAAEAQPKPSEWQVAERKRRNAMIARLILGLVLLVLFVIFVSLNSDSVPVHFIFVETSTPLVWVFLVCALIGALVAFLLGRSGRRSSRKYIKELERRLDGEKRD